MSNTANAVATIEASEADVIVQVTLADNDTRPGIVFRFVDNDNFICWYKVDNFGRHKCEKRVAGTFTILHDETISTANGDVLKAELLGTQIKIYHNGSLRATITESAHQTATKHGLYHEISSTNARWEDFSITQ